MRSAPPRPGSRALGHAGLRSNRKGDVRRSRLDRRRSRAAWRTKSAQAEIKRVLASKLNATVYSYPGQWHAFTRLNGAHYNAAAAALANARTSEFLKQQLR